MSSSGSSHKQERRGESSDDRAMKGKHNKTGAPNNRLPVDQAIVKKEQLEISRNMAATNTGCLPPEIVEGIIALLPYQSIRRFRFLSKSWFSLLVIKYEVPKLLFCRETGSTDPFTKLLNKQTLFKSVVLPGYGDNVIIDAVYLVPELQGGNRLYAFVGSCNGLVCLQCLVKTEIFVLNPFTGICRKLPHLSSFSRNWRYRPYVVAFGYDSASDDYKVFLTGDGAKVAIFSLKTGSWRKLENPDKESLQHVLSSGGMGLLLNGALHWGPGGSVRGETTKITAFDLNKEKFYHVPSPSDRYGDPVYTLGVVGEYLCIRDSQRRETDETLWVMKEYCSEASWVPLVSYSNTSFMSYSNTSYRYLGCLGDFIPRSFKNGRNVMLQFAQGEIHVLRWNNIEWNNSLDESDGAGKYSKNIEMYGCVYTEAVAYTETLSLGPGKYSWKGKTSIIK
ncbi:hypothetical protein Tsubulata_006853 [Turnera subulata]|uniref:F-box domain-containing protein n=1 Tax=Turnera subulata TaxID=218843 RepID=A0A9Q0JKW6_9ROSI|nr:hypothetical protein Tsubulata_006853 [Turnera subulata]